MLKCCRRMAKLSHAPSTANLLAQYTSLKGRPVPEQKHVLFPSKSFHQSLIYLTVQPPGAASYQNVTLAPSLHVWQESLDCLDGPQEIDLEDVPHCLQRLHLQWSHQTHPSIAHWKHTEQHCSHTLHFSSGITGLTQNIDPFLHNPHRRLLDGLLAGHIHLEYVQGVLVQPSNTF